MHLTKISGTQIRDKTYHLNLPIPFVIRHLHPQHATGIMRGTLRTADPKEAERQVREQRAIFDRQVKEAHRLKDRDRVLGALGQEDRDLLAEIGGPDRLLDTIRELRREAAFTLAATGAETALARETTDAAPHALRMGGTREEQEARAAPSSITAESRRLKCIAAQIGEAIPGPPSGLDEGATGNFLLRKAGRSRTGRRLA